MSTFNYGRSVATANRMIKRAGKTAQLRRRAAGSDDGSHSWNSGPASTPPEDRPINVVVTSYSINEVDGENILATDLKVFASTEGVTVPPDKQLDQLIIDGKEHEIKNVDPLKPGDTLVLWEMQVGA